MFLSSCLKHQKIMAGRHKVSKPMMVNGNIWYILDEFGKYQWMVYNIDLNLHSFIAVIPHRLSFNMRRCVADGAYIYSINDEKNVVVFDTENKTYSIKITANEFRNQIPDQYNNTYFIANGQIFLFTAVYNIKMQKFKPIKCVNQWNGGQLFQDQKTKKVFVLKRKIYEHVIGELESVKENNDEYRYTINACYKLHAPPSPFVNYLLYDLYVISKESIQIGDFDYSENAYIQDLVQSETGLYCMNTKGKGSNMIIVNHHDDMDNFIVSRFVKMNNKLYIPKDILSLIVLFHGDYYNKKIHFFTPYVDGDDFQYHQSISLGVFINRFIQETQREESKQAEEKGIEVDAEKDERNEYENVLNEWKSIKNEEDELGEKLLRGYEKLNEQTKKIIKEETKEIQAADETMVNEWKSIQNEQNELIEKFLKEYQRLNERYKSLKEQLKMIEK